MKRLAPLLASLSVLGCGGDDVTLGRVAQGIVNGKDSDATQDAVVLLVRYDPSLPGGMASDCSGTMLSPRIVLTARHCVSITDGSAACNDEGKADFGGKVLGDYKARSVFAFAGTTRPDILGGAASAARGVELVTNGSGTYCDDDVALVILEKPLPNAKIAPVRLEGTATPGEKVTLVGWGFTEKTAEPAVRQQRNGVPILEVGPSLGLGPKEIRIGEGSCLGDSGGPLLSEATGAVLGVLSRGGNGKDEGPPDACLGGENIYTSTGAHAPLVRAAFEKTGETPWLEGEPDPATRVPEVAPSVAEGDGGGCALAVERRTQGRARGAVAYSSTGALLALVVLARRRLRRA